MTTTERPAPVASFEEFYGSEYGRIVGLALVLTGSRSAAEDLAWPTRLAPSRGWEPVVLTTSGYPTVLTSSGAK